ncbi:hypothetical protein C8F04DRAFT_1272603 [Mycena alexandri]|uniref:Uncharacterized protein n=1 Tax=Mycena alexandri TaxID=1745969 RepID=A0AAD6WRN4_9AGAR|nr:hypothetical protein C8F04DRAFT_1272603 [Mycena alexandri]
MNGKKEPGDEPDEWVEAFGTFFDLYFKAPVPDKFRPRSWDDPNWQTGEPDLAAHLPRPSGQPYTSPRMAHLPRRSGQPFLEYTPPRMKSCDGTRVETEWASMVYTLDVAAERKERPAAMRETHRYLDYLRNKRHTFTPEEREHNDDMWARRQQARRRKYRRMASKRKVALCATTDSDVPGGST